MAPLPISGSQYRLVDPRAISTVAVGVELVAFALFRDFGGFWSLIAMTLAAMGLAYSGEFLLVYGSRQDEEELVRLTRHALKYAGWASVAFFATALSALAWETQGDWWWLTLLAILVVAIWSIGQYTYRLVQRVTHG